MTHMKSRLDLISPELMIGVGNALAHGCEKHGAEYPMPTRWSEQYGSIMRHLVRWYAGETNDPSAKNLPHLAMAAARINFLMMFENRGEGVDDRPMMFQKATKAAAGRGSSPEERDEGLGGQSGASEGEKTLPAGSYADDEFAGALAAGMLGFADELNAAQGEGGFVMTGTPTDAEVAEAEAFAEVLRQRRDQERVKNGIARQQMEAVNEAPYGKQAQRRRVRDLPLRPGLQTRQVAIDKDENR